MQQKNKAIYKHLSASLPLINCMITPVRQGHWSYLRETFMSNLTNITSKITHVISANRTL